MMTKGMKTLFVQLVVLLVASCAASAQATTQKWTIGWDNFSEPLDFNHSTI